MHKDAVNFLRETVVLMWGNPFDSQEVYLNQKLPQHIVTSLPEEDLPNPLHLFTPRSEIEDL